MKSIRSSAVFSNLCSFIPYNLSSLTNVFEYCSIWEIDDHKTKIRPLFMLWTVPRWRKSVVLDHVVFQWLWLYISYQLELFRRVERTNSEIALNSKCHISTYTQAFHCRDTLHLNLWILKAGFTVHIFAKAVICFFFFFLERCREQKDLLWYVWILLNNLGYPFGPQQDQLQHFLNFIWPRLVYLLLLPCALAEGTNWASWERYPVFISYNN